MPLHVIDDKSIIGFLLTSMFIFLGTVNPSSIAIWIGILAGVSTAALNGVKIYKELKRQPKENEEEDDD